MPGLRATLAEPLLQQAVPFQRGLNGRKFLLVRGSLFLLAVGFATTRLFSLSSVQITRGGGEQKPMAVSMAWLSLQRATADWQFPWARRPRQPAVTSPKLQPARQPEKTRQISQQPLSARTRENHAAAPLAATPSSSASVSVSASGAEAALDSSPLGDQSDSGDLRSSVVKIFNTRQLPNWYVPWQTKPVESTTGSGAVVRIPSANAEVLGVLTAAHVISESRYLQIQRSSDRFGGEKFPARVVAVCHESDLALLVLENAGDALADITPLNLAPPDKLPTISQKVRVIGYPIGGDACSVTEGTVSRVEVQEYSHSYRRGLAMTVDAAINSGNSGGPVVDAMTEEVVGVAIQKLVASGVELQGHAVPSPLLWRFLYESADAMSRPSGAPYRMLMPALATTVQTLESPALRRSLGLPENKSGMLIPSCVGNAPTALLPGDVLMDFDGHALDNLGFCEVLGQRLQFQAARDLRAVGDEVKLTVWRDGKEQVLRHKLAATQNLVPRGQHDVEPPFFICGGFVFQVLSHEFLQSIQNPPPHLMRLLLSGAKSPELEEVVVLTQILEDQVNYGYGSGYVGAPVITAVNGKPIRDLKHFIHLVGEARSSGVKFLKFDCQGARGLVSMVLPAEDLGQADLRIRNLYGAPNCSRHFT